MVRILDTAELTVTPVGADTPSESIPGTDITSAEITRRIQGWKDSAAFTVDNAAGTYTDTISTGDKLEFVGEDVPPGPHHDTPHYGRTRYGESTYGGGIASRAVEWAGLAPVPDLTEEGRDQITLSLSNAPGFVFEILSFRRPFATYEDRTLAEDETDLTGDSSAIVNDLVRRHTPEIDRSGIADIDATVSESIAGDDMLEAVMDLAERGDAILASEGETLIFQAVDDLHRQFDLKPRDHDTLTVGGSENSLANDWRLIGGEDVDLDESQETVDSYTTITDSARVTHQLDPEKLRLKFVSLWTRDTGTEESIRIRIQRPNADNTGPRDPDNDRLDIENAQLSHEFLADDGWVDRGWQFRQNVLPDSPWLILETDGPDGQDIGVDANGTPAFKTFYPYEVAAKQRDQDSIDTHRLREETYTDNDVIDFESGRDLIAGKLRHNNEPERTISFEAESLRAHQLQPADVITIDKPRLSVSGEWVVTERNDAFDGSSNTLRTGLTLQSVDSV